MCRHVPKGEQPLGAERRVDFSYAADVPEAGVVFEPVAEVVQSVGVVDSAVGVADALQVAAEIAEGGLVVFMAEVEGEHVFDVGGAVELAQVDDESFFFVSFERLFRVGYSAQLSGEIEDGVGRCVLSARALQQLHDFDAVGRSVVYVLGTGGQYDGEDQYEEGVAHGGWN